LYFYCLFTIFHNLFPEKSTVSNLNDALDAECIVIATDHPEFKEISPGKIKEKGIKVVVDGKNCIDKKIHTYIQIYLFLHFIKSLDL